MTSFIIFIEPKKGWAFSNLARLREVKSTPSYHFPYMKANCHNIWYDTSIWQSLLTNNNSLTTSLLLHNFSTVYNIVDEVQLLTKSSTQFCRSWSNKWYISTTLLELYQAHPQSALYILYSGCSMEQCMLHLQIKLSVERIFSSTVFGSVMWNSSNDSLS